MFNLSRSPYSFVKVESERAGGRKEKDWVASLLLSYMTHKVQVRSFLRGTRATIKKCVFEFVSEQGVSRYNECKAVSIHLATAQSAQ